MYTRIALRALKVSYSDVSEGGIAVNCEKTQFFLNTLYVRNRQFFMGKNANIRIICDRLKSTLLETLVITELKKYTFFV